MRSERRRSPRVQILGRLHGQIVAFDLAVTVTDISLGGLNFKASVPFPVGAVHDFRLTLGDGSPVVLKGRVVHSTMGGSDDETLYLTGVQFLDDPAQGPEATVDELIKKIH
jgi:hypothetical protein